MKHANFTMDNNTLYAEFRTLRIWGFDVQMFCESEVMLALHHDNATHLVTRDQQVRYISASKGEEST